MLLAVIIDPYKLFSLTISTLLLVVQLVKSFVIEYFVVTSIDDGIATAVITILPRTFVMLILLPLTTLAVTSFSFIVTFNVSIVYFNVGVKVVEYLPPSLISVDVLLAPQFDKLYLMLYIVGAA